MTRDWSRDLDLAMALADTADGMFRERITKLHDVNTKCDGSPVTAADIEVEHALLQILRAERPQDHIIAEESAFASHGAAVSEQPTWVIDPLDHTQHFLRGNPEYGTLVALVVDGRPRVGVVTAPSLERRWWALAGHGAWHNNRPIRVSSTHDVGLAHISIAGHREWVHRYHWSGVAKLLDRVKYPSGSPGGFLPAMMVATGQLDAFAEPWGLVWDHAALVAIVEEAGGRCSTLDGRPILGGSLLASNGAIHDELLKYFVQCTSTDADS